MGKVVLETTDRDGEVVRLYAAQWKHIRLGHPEMEEALDAIRITVEDPDIVTRSDTLAIDAGGERRINSRFATHPRYRGVYVRVPIEYAARGNWITTAYLNALPPEGDLLYVRLPSR